MATGRQVQLLGPVLARHQLVGVGVDCVVEQLPRLAAVGRLDHVANLERCVKRVRVGRVHDDVADVGLDRGNRIVDLANARHIRDAVQRLPVLASVVGHPERNRLATGVHRVGIVGVDGHALDLARAGLAAVGLGPGLAVVLGSQDAVAAGSGVDAVGCAGLDRDLIDVPLLDAMRPDRPLGACVVDGNHAFSRGDVQNGAHIDFLSLEHVIIRDLCLLRRTIARALGGSKRPGANPQGSARGPAAVDQQVMAGHRRASGAR